MLEAWFREPLNQILAMGAALLLVGVARLPRLLAWARRLPLGIAGRGGLALGRLGLARPAVAPPPATVPGAASALLHPPGVAAGLERMRAASPQDRYLLPIGWYLTSARAGDLAHTALVGETNHLLISGTSDVGKDNLAWWMLLSLALAHPSPQELQVCLIDGKGLDFKPWRGKAQTWLLASEPEAIPAALRALTAERQRRTAILDAADVRRWDDYRGGDLPLLVVFISELSLLETALRRERVRRDRDRSQDLDLEAWLNSELAAGRAFGIRYLIGMQTVTGMEMRWRAQIGVFLAGHQPDESQVKPNTGRTAKQIAAAGAAPPHRLPPPPAGAGVFTVVSGAQCVTVRAPYLDDAERRRWLARLPDRPRDEADLLSSLFADRSPVAAPPTPAQPPQPASGNGAHPAENAPETVPAPENAHSAAAPAVSLADEAFSVSHLAFSPAEIAVIAVRIARGETKTEVVKQMPGYATRRHRAFAAYYDMLYSQLAEQGMIEV